MEAVESPQPSRLDLGFELARSAHHHQTDKLGVNYFAHVKHVMDLVALEHADEDLWLIALLHDSIEDSDVSIIRVDALFGGRVADGVVAMTRLPEEDYFTAYLPRLMSNPDAVKVKLADSRHNRGKGHLLARLDLTLAEQLEAKYSRVIEILTGSFEPALRLSFSNGTWR